MIDVIKLHNFKVYKNLWCKNHKFDYEFELKCGKYFIDFAIKDKMIALEIDGKQHLYEDRIIKDKEKDEYLKNYGWKVYRIP